MLMRAHTSCKWTRIVTFIVVIVVAYVMCTVVTGVITIGVVATTLVV